MRTACVCVEGGLSKEGANAFPSATSDGSKPVWGRSGYVGCGG